MKKFTRMMLDLAFIMDAWRVIPRVIVASYGYMIYKLFIWYTSIPTNSETQCDSALIKILTDSGVDLAQATELACTIVGTVGGPTTQQTSFVTIIVGLSSAMFAFYVNSGDGWKKFVYNKETKENHRWSSSVSADDSDCDKPKKPVDPS